MAKYYYNGVLLPEIPDALLEDYPYAWIRNNTTTGYYDLFLSPVPFYTVDSDSMSGSGTTKPFYRVAIATVETATEWEANGTSDNNIAYDSARTVLWSNHDIPNGSATATDIYFYGSEPVPEIIVISKYLIRSGSTIYTVTDGSLTALPETNLNANLFLNSGFDSIPDSTLLVTLADPEVFYWHDSQDDLPVLTANVTGTPFPQTVITNDVDMSDPTVLGIESVEISASDDVLFAMSFDGGTTWKGYINQWVTLETENSGMTAAQFRNIPIEAWAQQATTGHYMVRFILSDADSYVERITIHYIN